MMANDLDRRIHKLADMIIESSRVVVFTGAGISTESGIPDFRSPGGIWTKYDPNLFTIQHFLNDIEARKLHWKVLSDGEFIPHSAESNKAHRAIADLEKLGKLSCVVTQNVDYLHEDGGCPPEKVFHLHGTMGRAICLQCGKLIPMDEIRGWIRNGTEIPICPDCGGILKPDAVFFGEALPQYEYTESQRRALSCDLCLVIGSSLVVTPAAYIPQYAVQSGARLAIINRDPTHLDSYAEVCIYDSAGDTMFAVIKMLRKQLQQ